MVKQTIRFNTFETNSSSTHNLIIIPDKYYKDWSDDKLFYLKDDWYSLAKKLIQKNNGCRFFTKEFLMNDEDVINSDNFPKKENYDEDENYEYEDDLIQFFRDEDLVTASMFDNDELESEENTYTTENGELLHIICQFGYDG